MGIENAQLIGHKPWEILCICFMIYFCTVWGFSRYTVCSSIHANFSKSLWGSLRVTTFWQTINSRYLVVKFNNCLCKLSLSYFVLDIYTTKQCASYSLSASTTQSNNIRTSKKNIGEKIHLFLFSWLTVVYINTGHEYNILLKMTNNKMKMCLFTWNYFDKRYSSLSFNTV
jgi:hypothetical protein